MWKRPTKIRHYRAAGLSLGAIAELLSEEAAGLDAAQARLAVAPR
jgi:DNA-binding transcriptional MerR regulator